MTFANPAYLFGMLLLVPLGVLAWFRWRREKAVRQAFAAASALEKMGIPAGIGRSLARSALLMIAWVSLVVGLARPQGDPIWFGEEQFGSDVVLAVDVSESMRALDGGPGERLGAARTIINFLLQGLQGDRVGLVAFAGTAVSLCPLTSDYAVLSSFVDELDINAGVEPGTSLAAAVAAALRRFPAESKGGRLIVLFSDGEDLGDQVDLAVQLASQRGIPIAAVGIGRARGTPIPVGEDMWGNTVFKTYQGQEVVTRLDERALKKLASRSGGRYWRTDNHWQTSQSLQAYIRSLNKQALRSTSVQQYREYFPWLLGLAAAALLSELVLTLSRYRLALPFTRRHGQLPQPVGIRQAVFLLLVLAASGQVAWTWPWEPYRANRQGLNAFDNRDYAGAAQAFRRAAETVRHFVPWYNLGNALYRQKRYRDAQEAYQRALNMAPSEAQSRLYYNLGNTYYRQAKGKERNRWLARALEAYTRSSQLNPQDEDAQANAEFVRRLLQNKPPPSGGGASPPPSPRTPDAGRRTPAPSSSPTPGAGPQPPAAGSPQPGGSAGPSPGTAPEEMHQIEEFLKQMERLERLSQNYFRHRRGITQHPSRPLTDIPIEELMNMSPEELAELLRQQFNTGQARLPSRGGKDW